MILIRVWLVTLCSLLVASFSLGLDGPDKNNWSQWHGPHRDAISAETGLLKKWPENGPPLLYQQAGFGDGYSTPVVDNGIIYGMSWRGEKGSKIDGVWAFDEASKKELWFTSIGKADEGIDKGPGPRSSPTIDGDKLYAVTANGDLGCLELATGRVIWKSSYKTQLGGKMMSVWGFSESVLVDGDKVIGTPGGDDNSIVAFNKETGSIIWKSAIKNSGGAGYASPVVMTIDGARMYVTWLGKCIVGVDAQTGKELWRNDKVAGKVANITTPIIKDDLVFCTTGYTSYNGGSVLLQIVKEGEKFVAKEKWYLDARGFENHHGGVVLVDGYLYGGHGQNDGQLTCIDFATGKVKYRNRGVAKGSAALLCADGHLYYRYQDGTMVLVKINPEKEEIVSKFTLPYDSGKPSWPHPVICNGKLYIRDMDVLMCFDVKAK